MEKDVIEKIQNARVNGNTHFMVVVAEGVASAYDIANVIREGTGLEPRVTVLGHIQRGGSPQARDRESATRMGYQAVMEITKDNLNVIIGIRDGSMVAIPIEEALSMKKKLPMERYDVLEAMSKTARPPHQM